MTYLLDKAVEHLERTMNQMTEFKLCEEMGLEPKAVFAFALESSEQVIKASDVEKMLQGGRAVESKMTYSWNEIRGSNSFSYTTTCERDDITKTITLTVPQKPKPVTKDEIIKTLKMYNQNGNLASEVLERIEKAGIE